MADLNACKVPERPVNVMSSFRNFFGTVNSRSQDFVEKGLLDFFKKSSGGLKEGNIFKILARTGACPMGDSLLANDGRPDIFLGS